jgi:hypothetical protein
VQRSDLVKIALISSVILVWHGCLPVTDFGHDHPANIPNLLHVVKKRLYITLELGELFRLVNSSRVELVVHAKTPGPPNLSGTAQARQLHPQSPHTPSTASDAESI